MGQWCRSRGGYHRANLGGATTTQSGTDLGGAEWCRSRGATTTQSGADLGGGYHDSEWCRSRGDDHDSGYLSAYREDCLDESGDWRGVADCHNNSTVCVSSECSKEEKQITETAG